MDKNSSIDELINTKGIKGPFYRAGLFITKKLFYRKNSFYYRKIYEKNSLLYSPAKAHDMTYAYFTEKFGLMLMCLIFGGVLIILLCLKGNDSSKLVNGTTLIRNPSDGKSYEVVLNAKVGNKEYKNISIEVAEQKLSEDEFYDSMDEFCKKVDKEILGSNKSIDMVTEDLILLNSLDGYPYTIKWTSSSRHVVNSKGKLWDKGYSLTDDSQIVTLSAEISYGNYTYIYEFAVKVATPDLSEEDQMVIKIRDLVNESSEKTKGDKEFVLPNSIDSTEIIWSEEKKSKATLFVLILILSLLAIFFGKDKDISRKIDKRQEEMLDDYPEIVSKLALLTGAGMSIRNAWKKISLDYKASGSLKRFIYDEMVITTGEMESGVEEAVCFAHFTGRVKLQKYVKLVSLLQQNLHKGTKTFMDDLANEAREAFFEKKNNAEKLGEKAGTKLMLPMFMMLLIVVVVIMVPAFSSM